MIDELGFGSKIVRIERLECTQGCTIIVSDTVSLSEITKQKLQPFKAIKSVSNQGRNGF